MSDDDYQVLVHAVGWIERHAGFDAPEYPQPQELAHLVDTMRGGVVSPLARDRAGNRRDRDATERDRDADDRDRKADNRDTRALLDGEPATIEEAYRQHRLGAADRADSARDRDSAREDRSASAQDRKAASADDQTD
jgi:hypothetical protein